MSSSRRHLLSISLMQLREGLPREREAPRGGSSFCMAPLHFLLVCTALIAPHPSKKCISAMHAYEHGCHADLIVDFPRARAYILDIGTGMVPPIK